MKEIYVFIMAISLFVICTINLFFNPHKKEIAILKQELLIDETYLSNIHLYRKPLWATEKDKEEFKKWRREAADREMKTK